MTGLRLVCCPPAGAGAGFFSPLRRSLPSTLALDCYIPPGHERRWRESPLLSIGELADDLRQQLGGCEDAVVLGHSFGGYVAYETARRAERADGPPIAVVVSACPPPDRTEQLATIAALDDDELVGLLQEMGGVPLQVAATRAFRPFWIPAVRSDLACLAAYRPGPIGIPLVTVAGRNDGQATPQVVSGWQEYSSAPVVQHVVQGTHFFAIENPEVLANVLLSLLSGHPERVPLMTTGSKRKQNG